MQKSQVNLKDPLLAAILAFLIPGLGHLYQGRLFKAAIYSVCIIALYAYGGILSNWKIVEYRGGRGEPRTKLLSFMAQAGVGLPGLFALNQSRRYRNANHQVVTSLAEPISSPFVGEVSILEGDADIEGEIRGQMELAPAAGQFGDPVIIGKIIGTMPDGSEETLTLGEGVRLGPRLQNNPRREVRADVVDETGARIGRVEGSMPRSFWNWFAVPLSNPEEQELHRELGKYHELALVFTMIAGLLNILAVWDAFDGPAYGYGRESENSTDEPPSDESRSSHERATAGAAT